MCVNGNKILLLAKGQERHWWDAVGVFADQYYQGDPVLLVLDSQLRLIDVRKVKVKSSLSQPKMVGYEDFRMFQYEDQIWVNHGMISLIRKHECSLTFDGAVPCLSRLNTATNSLTLVGYPKLDFATNSIEKNWVYFELEGNLFLLYSVSPFRLLKLHNRSSLAFTTVISRDLGPRLHDVGGFGTLVSFSTNPIEYDDDHQLFLIHQVQRRGSDRFYHHWGVLLSKKTLLPEHITEKPLFFGNGARGRRAGILYVSSVLRVEDKFLFFMGEGDAYSTYCAIDHEDLEDRWSPLENSKQ